MTESEIIKFLIMFIIYLFIGFQFGARTFYWGHRIEKSISNFIVPLILVPLVWPVIVVMAFFHEPSKDAIFNFDD